MSKRRSKSFRSPRPNRPNTKRVSEHSEAVFLYRASQRQFAICKP